MNSILPVFLRLAFEGRINRFRYIFFLLGIWFILTTLNYLWFVLYGIKRIFVGEVSLFIPWIFYFIGIIYYFSLMIRRLYDLNRSLLFTIPTILILVIDGFISPYDVRESTLYPFLWLVNLLLFFYLLLFKGTKGANQYGPDPLEYSNYEKYLDELDHPEILEDHRFER